MKFLLLIVLLIALSSSEIVAQRATISAACINQVRYCNGYSLWRLEDVGAPGYHVYFRFQSSRCRDCVHTLTIYSQCFERKITYETINQCYNCPLINYGPSYLVNVNTNLCRSRTVFSAHMTIANSISPGSNGGYCIAGSLTEMTFVPPGSGDLKWVAGDHEIWFL